MSSSAAPSPLADAPVDLGALGFSCAFTRALPADPQTDNVRRQVHGACYSRVEPATASAPELLLFSGELAAELGLSEAQMTSAEMVATLAGNQVLDGMDPHAVCYGGHQFGNWAGQLGDGRAIALGELTDRNGTPQMLQLKGAGPTPYSRQGDGFAVLRSSLREFLCSEAMFHLGVPTTRALSLIGTGDMVMRDMFYDGHPAAEPGAVVCRVAPSFVRFGNFEIFAARGDLDTQTQLVRFVYNQHFERHSTDAGEQPTNEQPTSEMATAIFARAVETTAELVVEWLRVGFVHGVLNTDNMSILGLTIDYGPYGWLDDYDPDWTPNTTDAAHRRYRFGAQPAVAQWNLLRLANALAPLVGDAEPLQVAMDGYVAHFERRWRQMTAAKLGLPSLEEKVDADLADEALAVLRATETDMTIWWRKLADVTASPVAASGAAERAVERATPLAAAYYKPAEVGSDARAATQAFCDHYAARLGALGIDDDARRVAMNRVNPKYVLRNYLAQRAIDAAESGDTAEAAELFRVMKRPYDEQPEAERYAALRPDWARSKPGCSQLSCSS